MSDNEKRRIENMEAALHAYRIEAQDLRTNLAAEQLRRESLRKWLLNKVEHHGDCDIRITGTKGCTCGLEDLRKELTDEISEECKA